MEGWPCHGLMVGDDILKPEVFDAIQKFDYNLCEPRAVYGYKRKTKEFCAGSKEVHATEAEQALQDLTDYLSDFELLESLIAKSYWHEKINISSFWTGGIDTLRRLYRGAGLSINEDSPFKLTPHSDNRTVIANIQIYLDPPDPDIGTRFHDMMDMSNSQKLPFTPNTGYFLVNSDMGIHSVIHDKDIKRRSILFGWMI